MLTVRELARDLELGLLAGDDAADAPVRWVHVSELPDPTPWLSGGELLLTTGMALRGGGGREYLGRLADKGLAGLGVGVRVGGLESVPQEMADAARERSFPLFEVPYAVPFIALTEQAATHIVNEQAALLERALAAHERLERVLLSERGLDGIVGALA